jgi:hypothetical protein
MYPEILLRSLTPTLSGVRILHVIHENRKVPATGVFSDMKRRRVLGVVFRYLGRGGTTGVIKRRR